MESVTFVTEPLLHEDFVQFEIVVPILERLRDDFELSVAAPQIAPRVRAALERRGIGAIDGGASFPRIRRSRDEIPSYVMSWFRDTLAGSNRKLIEKSLRDRPGLRVNASMTTACNADVWFIQSRPLGLALSAIQSSSRLSIRTGISVVRPVVGPLDVTHIREISRRVHRVVSSTRHVAEWCANHRIHVDRQIPIYYRPIFRPSTGSPSRDYILAYIGKETDAQALRGLLESDVPVRLFGSKSPGWVASLVRPDRWPNVIVYGKVTDEQLRDLYTNARFTAFPFTEESFGLVPVESMACGTPVLTYGIQGPSETVVHDETGWLVQNRAQFLAKTAELWKIGYPSNVSARCLERARIYHLDHVTEQWRALLFQVLSETAATHRRDLREREGAERPSPVSTGGSSSNSGSSSPSNRPESAPVERSIPWGETESVPPVEAAQRV